MYLVWIESVVSMELAIGGWGSGLYWTDNRGPTYTRCRKMSRIWAKKGPKIRDSGGAR